MKKKYEYNKMRVNVWVDKDLYKKFKALLTLNNTTTTKELTKYIKEYVENEQYKLFEKNFLNSF